MCKRGPHFKFCTCDPKDLGKNFWKLTRGPKYSRSNIMGKFVTPADEHPFDERQFCIDRMLFDLNNKPIFDFEYTPEENDFLEITLNFGKQNTNIHKNLIYKDGEFKDEFWYEDDHPRNQRLDPTAKRAYPSLIGIGQIKYKAK